MEEQAYTPNGTLTGARTISGGLSTAVDRSVIQTRLDNLGKEIAALGEEASRFINRVSTVRRLQPTEDSELNAKYPEEHASEVAIRLDQLSRQVTYIVSSIKNASEELEL